MSKAKILIKLANGNYIDKKDFIDMALNDFLKMGHEGLQKSKVKTYVNEVLSDKVNPSNMLHIILQNSLSEIYTTVK